MTKIYKIFLANCTPTDEASREVIVEGINQSWNVSFYTVISAIVQNILKAVADRATIEPNLRHSKEARGAGQQRIRDIWTNVAAYRLSMWARLFVELWLWKKSHRALCDRCDSPLDEPNQRRIVTGPHVFISCITNNRPKQTSGYFHEKSLA